MGYRNVRAHESRARDDEQLVMCSLIANTGTRDIIMSEPLLEFEMKLSLQGYRNVATLLFIPTTYPAAHSSYCLYNSRMCLNLHYSDVHNAWSLRYHLQSTIHNTTGCVFFPCGFECRAITNFTYQPSYTHH